MTSGERDAGNEGGRLPVPDFADAPSGLRWLRLRKDIRGSSLLVTNSQAVDWIARARDLAPMIEAAQAGLLEDKRTETDTLLSERREVLP